MQVMPLDIIAGAVSGHERLLTLVKPYGVIEEPAPLPQFDFSAFAEAA